MECVNKKRMILGQEYEVKKMTNPRDIAVKVPGSKSITNRALLIAALTDGKSVLNGVLFSDDSRNFLQALKDMGFKVEVDEERERVEIVGNAGLIPNNKSEIYVGSAGTAARFLTALCGLEKGEFKLTSSEQMKKRPMKELLESLVEIGANVEYLEEKYHFPYIIKNNIANNIANNIESNTVSKTENNTVNNTEINIVNERDSVTVNIDKSSQFLSALLISSVVLNKKFTIHVEGNHGMAYVKMTVKMMEQFGVKVQVSTDEKTYTIPANSKYKAREYDIEPDISAACYFYAMSPILGINAEVKGVKLNSLQGDIAFLDVLKDMGCNISVGNDKQIIVMPPRDGSIKGGSWDLSAFSDQALTLAAVAYYCHEKVEIKNIGHIQFQECDRINAIIENLKNAGKNSYCISSDGNAVKNVVICDDVRSEDLTIKDRANQSKINEDKTNQSKTSKDEINQELAQQAKKVVRIKTFDDHRVAMAFSLIGLRKGNVIIENPSCCKKTFETYFDVLESLYRP